ncbi:MAG: hypothetical protein A3A86_02875 [Elusimicrobia bacterium RIFCSPLOWO2_01_FULL_60_11]|nr:MAG: hypothetical protein A3A86_02875 [Elusimicrobia bacterium RIFCSPLOWO2_01_FULL_60_11]
MNISMRAALAALALTLASGAGHAGTAKDASVGRILKSSAGKSIMETGDKVTVLFKKGGSARPGSRFTVYKVAIDLMNTPSDSDREAKKEVEVGTVEIVELKGSRRAVGKVTRVMGDFEPGNLLKPEAP